MSKKVKFLSVIMALFSLMAIFSFNSITVKADEKKVYLGGFPAGFSLSTRGANIVGICDVVTEKGVESPSKNADIRVGDVILSIDNKEVNNAEEVGFAIKNKEKVLIDLKRCGEILSKCVYPAKDLSGEYKLGVFIKDDICGIGTVTYIDENRFASLGHPVINEDGSLLEILGGNVFDCSITGCVKGERGKAGELRGVFLKTNPVAIIDKNSYFGVYGNVSDNFNYDNLTEISLGTAQVGDADIYTTVNGKSPEKYSISIIKIDNDNGSKNFVIRINDKNLLEKTNGIVQGMSGSPIVQNGKLVGAVTHVFINDPTRGFGLSVYNMINN